MKSMGGMLARKKFCLYSARIPTQSFNRQSPCPCCRARKSNARWTSVLRAPRGPILPARYLAWFKDYVELLSKVHLTLWIRYGIALESNQQNAIIAFNDQGKMTLAMKDNDAARIWPERFQAYEHASPVKCEQLLDQRIKVDNELALGQMFTTITLQLDIAAIIEAMAAKGITSSASLYKVVADSLSQQLEQLSSQGHDIKLAKDMLFNSPNLYAKYLLSSGSLLSKQASGASDINKFYGLSAPNFLLLTSEKAQQAYLDTIEKSVS